MKIVFKHMSHLGAVVRLLDHTGGQVNSIMISKGLPSEIEREARIMEAIGALGDQAKGLEDLSEKPVQNPLEYTIEVVK